MDTLKPCKQVSNKQLDEMNEQIEQLRDVIGMLSTDLDDLKANLVVDKGTISNLSSDTINTNDLYVNNNAEIKNAIISYIEKNHQYFNTMENHLDFGSFTNEADLDIILRAEADEQIIKIHIAENMAVSYSNAKSICNNIKLYKKDNKLYLSGNNLKPGKEVLVLIYAASDEFAINQPVPVDAALLGEAKVSSKFDIQSVDRPEWNNKALALLADVVSGGVTKAYKGVLETEDELPKTDNKQGDLYIIKATKKGYVGEAVFDGIAWVVQSFYELQFYFNKDEVNALIEAEANRAVTEETRLGETITANAEASTNAINDVINGITPVKAVAQGATSGGHTLALTDDALMLYGAQGMNNIPESSSLDDLVKCGQYSADADLAATLTETPEAGAFDLIVGYEQADKNKPYQVYINANGHIYRRSSTDGYYNEWKQFATTDGRVREANYLAADYHKDIDLDTLPSVGKYRVITNIYNGPNGQTDIAIVYVINYDQNWPIQIYESVDQQNTFIRYKRAGSAKWGKWQQIATSNAKEFTNASDIPLISGDFWCAGDASVQNVPEPGYVHYIHQIVISDQYVSQHTIVSNRNASEYVREKTEGVWTSWRRVLTNTNGWDFRGGTPLPKAGFDLNTLNTGASIGTYSHESAIPADTVIHRPPTATNAGVLIVSSQDGSTIFITQIWLPYLGGTGAAASRKIYKRDYNPDGGGWTHWYRFEGIDDGA